MPFDFNTKHLPCDLDFSGRDSAIDSYPNHCIWVWNNRYTHEGWYRVYKTYQLEAFFFGQYYERLKRYEIDPHTWDYDN
ncbi:CG30270, partial [Drosophila busckii]